MQPCVAQTCWEGCSRPERHPSFSSADAVSPRASLGTGRAFPGSGINVDPGGKGRKTFLISFGLCSCLKMK